MARYEHLPIFKAVYDLTLEMDRRVHEFSRYHKYSIGSDLRQCCREILRLVIQANDVWKKEPVLLEIRWKTEYLKTLLRLAFDSGAFPTGKTGYLYMAEKAVDAARQNEGWLKGMKGKTGNGEMQ
jgi:hypothetical protein